MTPAEWQGLGHTFPDSQEFSSGASCHGHRMEASAEQQEQGEGAERSIDGWLDMQKREGPEVILCDTVCLEMVKHNTAIFMIYRVRVF